MSFGEFYIFILIVFSLGGALGFGFGTKAIANAKGYSNSWFWFGFFCGLIGLIVAASMQPTRRYREMQFRLYGLGSSGHTSGTNMHSWICPQCASINPDHISKCSCGYDNSRSQTMLENEKRRMEERRHEKQRKEAEERQQKAEGVIQEAEKYLQENYGLGLTDSEKILLKIVSKNDDGITITAMLQQIPRNTNVEEVKKSVYHLEECGIMAQDNNGKYKMMLKTHDFNSQ